MITLNCCAWGNPGAPQEHQQCARCPAAFHNYSLINVALNGDYICDNCKDIETLREANV